MVPAESVPLIESGGLYEDSEGVFAIAESDRADRVMGPGGEAVRY